MNTLSVTFTFAPRVDKEFGQFILSMYDSDIWRGDALLAFATLDVVSSHLGQVGTFYLPCDRCYVKECGSCRG